MTGDVTIRLTSNVTDVAGNTLFASSITTVRVRPGDVNDDGTTTLADLHANVAGQFRSVGNASYQSGNDVDGNGVVNIVDLTLVRNHRAAESAAALVAEAESRNSRIGRRDRTRTLSRAIVKDVFSQEFTDP
jgi:hypothetical protein